jgi:hypothetical protein
MPVPHSAPEPRTAAKRRVAARRFPSARAVPDREAHGQRGTPDALLYAFFAPGLESLPYRRRRSIRMGQILPAATSGEDEDGTYDVSAVVGTWTTRAHW